LVVISYLLDLASMANCLVALDETILSFAVYPLVKRNSSAGQA